jgi:exonuclease SbcC
MQLHRVKLVNFRQHADTEIELGAGITAIIGPNGSGKTTLLEAIAWAFYGNPAARGHRDTLRWTRAPARSPVRVEVTFTFGAHEFRVARGLYNAELYQDRQDAPIANTQQEVTNRIERLLGMTRDEFFNTYFTGQKELAVMAAMGPTDRARFLSRVLGYEKLRLAQDRLRETRSELKGELAGLERGLADPGTLEAEQQAAEARLAEAEDAVQRVEARLAEAESRLKREAPAWTKMVETRETMQGLEGERRVAERDVTEARREFDRLDRELADALAARQRLEGIGETLERAAPLKAELERLEREAHAAGHRRSLAGQRAELDAQRTVIQRRLEALADVDAVLGDARRQLQEARAALEQARHAEEGARTAWVRDRQDAETKLTNLRDQYMDLKKNREQVVEAGPEGACPICKRPLGTLYEDMLGTLDRQLEEVEVRGKFFKQRADQLATEPGEVTDPERRTREWAAKVEATVQEVTRCENRVREGDDMRLELERVERRRVELEGEMAGLPDAYDAERHEVVRQDLKALEPIVEQAAELRVKAARAAQLVTDAEGAERSLSERERKVKELEAAIADLDFSEERYLGARDRYETAAKAVQDAELELASVKGDRKAAEAARQSAIQRLDERRRRGVRIDEIKADLRQHDELDRALHDLRLELNAQMRPELSERASAFVSELTDGRYSELELDEEYRILVIEDGQAKPVISGGEEDVANLVLRLAISQMVAERAGQPLSLLVLDEIFGSLDEHRRENVVQLLRRLADRFPQVVLITHIESVKDGVDRVLRVALDEQRGAAIVTEDPGAAGGADVAA